MATLTFSDDFNSLSLWSVATNKGVWATTFASFQDPATSNGISFTGNGEQEWYINSDYAATAAVKPWTVDPTGSTGTGVLTITAAPASAAIQPLINGYQYTSGELNTQHSFNQLYGYFEMRAELPAGQGVWPAFWLLPTNYTSPQELDVMEVLGKGPTQLWTSVHSSVTGASNAVATTVADTSAGFHTYGMDWEPDKITFYFDGQPVFSEATPADMNRPMYVIVNLALGGNWGGAVDSSTPFPAELQVDYIRAWDSNPYDPNSHPQPLVINGTRQADYLMGSGANDTINGSSGNDTLDGAGGDDKLTGGTGADQFIFHPGFGHDTITDFNHNQRDVLYIEFGGEHPTQTLSSAGLVLTFSTGDTVTLAGVRSLFSADMHFI